MEKVYVVGYTMEFSGEGFIPEYITTNEELARKTLEKKLSKVFSGKTIAYEDYECKVYEMGKELKKYEYNTL